MIKGVNKQVLEINETDNGFFEKAIFFVKPEYSGYSDLRLKADAQKELTRAGIPPQQKSHGKFHAEKKLPFLICGILGIVIGMAIAFWVK